MIQDSSSIRGRSWARTCSSPLSQPQKTRSRKPAAENPQNAAIRTQPSERRTSATEGQPGIQSVTELRAYSLANQVTAKGRETHRWQPARLQLALSTSDKHEWGCPINATATEPTTKPLDERQHMLGQFLFGPIMLNSLYTHNLCTRSV